MPRRGPDTSDRTSWAVRPPTPSIVLRVLPLFLFLFLVGCPPPAPLKLGPAVPIQQAVGLVNRNCERLITGLQALGSARGHFVDDNGTRRAFDCDANLLVLAPRHLRLDLTSLGQTQVLFGSNDEFYWLHVKPEVDTYWFGRYAELSDLDFGGIPIRPDMVVESLGINGLPEDTTGTAGPFQRVADDHQELLFVRYDRDGQGLIYKEYWLDRREPRLIGRILFRDAMGRVLMRSRLSDYRRLEGQGPLIAHRIDVDWPKDDAELHLKVRRWSVRLELTPKHRAFRPPHLRGKTFKRMIDIDKQRDEGGGGREPRGDAGKMTGVR
jgi:hypothetical protein